MKRLIQYALYQPLFIILGTLVFAAAGFAAFKHLSVEAFPDVTDTQVTVIAQRTANSPIPAKPSRLAEQNTNTGQCHRYTPYEMRPSATIDGRDSTHAVGEPGRQSEIVDDREHGGALMGDAAQQFHDDEPVTLVERCDRLVGDQHRGLRGQRARERDAGPLAAG